MKKLLRFLTLVLALLLCVAVFASCADNNTPKDTVKTEVEDDDPLAKRFKDANYNGTTFTIYAREDTSYSHKGIYATEQTGDLINDETLVRNQAVETKYNIKFDLIADHTPNATIAADVRSGMVEYDLVLDCRKLMAGCITSGYFYDWNSLGIDMSVSWWDSNCKEGYDINGKLYYAVNDVSIRNLADARFLYFSKQIVSDYGLANPYDLVDNNQWTLDKFVELTKSVSNPGADNKTLGVYGLLREVGRENGNHMHLITGCGISYVRWEDGQMVCNIDGNTVEKLQDIVDKLSTVLNKDYAKSYSDVDQIDTSTGYSNMFEKGRANFASGHFLFVQNGMGEADLFQDMKEGFGVVPNPKYNSDQEKYYHKVDCYSLIWAIPNVPDLINLDRLATVTDYWAYQSSLTVMPSFYEVVTKSKNADEAIAGKNLDIVKNSIYFEIGDLFDFGISEAIDEGFNNSAMGRYFNSTAMKRFNKQLEQINNTIMDLAD